MRSMYSVVLIVVTLLASIAAAQAPIVFGPKRIDPLIDPNTGDVHTVYALEYAAVAAGTEVTGVWATRPQDRGTGQDYRFRMLKTGHSADGGVTWTLESYHAPNSGDGGVEHNPFAAVDPRTGSMWVGGGIGDNGAFIKHRAYGALDWNYETRWLPPVGSHQGRAAAGPIPGDLNSTRIYFFTSGGIQITWSDDFGATWFDPPVYSNEIWPSLIGGTQPCVGSNGELYAADTMNGYITLARALSLDQDGIPSDASFHAAAPYISFSSGDFPGDFYGSTHPTIATDPRDGKRVFIIYGAESSKVNGQTDVDLYLVWTDDATADPITWSGPTIILDDDASSPDDPADQFMPWLVVDDRGWLHLIYIDSRNVPNQPDGNTEDGYYDFYYAYSQDDGANWTPVRLTPTTFNSKDKGHTGPQGGYTFFGYYVALASAGNRAYAFYPYTIPQDGDQDPHTEAHVSLIVVGNYATIDDWNIVEGTEQSVAPDPISESDDVHLLVGGVGQLVQSTTTEFIATSPYTDAHEIDVLIETSASVAAVDGELWAYNWNTQQFEFVSSFDVPMDDTIIERRTLDGASYVNNVTGEIRLEVDNVHTDGFGPLVSRYDHIQIIATPPLPN